MSFATCVCAKQRQACTGSTTTTDGKGLHRLAHYRDEARLMFRRDELDRCLEDRPERAWGKTRPSGLRGRS